MLLAASRDDPFPAFERVRAQGRSTAAGSRSSPRHSRSCASVGQPGFSSAAPRPRSRVRWPSLALVARRRAARAARPAIPARHRAPGSHALSQAGDRVFSVRAVEQVARCAPRRSPPNCSTPSKGAATSISSRAYCALLPVTVIAEILGVPSDRAQTRAVLRRRGGPEPGPRPVVAAVPAGRDRAVTVRVLARRSTSAPGCGRAGRGPAQPTGRRPRRGRRAGRP